MLIINVGSKLKVGVFNNFKHLYYHFYFCKKGVWGGGGLSSPFPLTPLHSTPMLIEIGPVLLQYKFKKKKKKVYKDLDGQKYVRKQTVETQKSSHLWQMNNSHLFFIHQFT